MSEPRDIASQLIHHPYRAPEGFESPAVAVHKASTVYFPSVAALRGHRWIDKSGYTYGLHGTPTTFTLEARLATLEGAKHVMLAPSGLSAVTVVDMTLLKSGDAVLLPDNVYNPSKEFARHELSHWGIAHRMYDPMQPETLRAAIGPDAKDVKLVWLEAPGSVTLEFPDLRALVAAVREAAPQATIALDNTWGAGLAFNAFEQGVDLTIHALTKYPSGGGDMLMGSIACRDTALYERLAATHSRLGLGVGANDAEAVLRALPTLALRYAAQDASARRVAAWAAAQAPLIRRVLHPPTPGSPGHEHWAEICRAAAGLLTMEFDPGIAPERVEAFVDGLKLFRIGWSWGGPVSLAVPYQTERMRQFSPYAGTLVRLSIGLEAADDLIADLVAGLERLRGA
ncbi:MAG TPA: PLP-dependent transferase [Ideonella sp.]|nr:PLP-dependent transferase [Ideonella sp.]